MSSPNESTASRLQRIGRRTDAIPEQADRFQDEVLLEDAFVVSEDNNNLEPEESEQNNSDHQQGKYHFPHALKSNLKKNPWNWNFKILGKNFFFADLMEECPPESDEKSPNGAEDEGEVEPDVEETKNNPNCWASSNSNREPSNFSVSDEFACL